MTHFGDHHSRGPSSLRSLVDMRTCPEGSGLWAGPLDAKCCDEDVHHHNDKDKGCRSIFQNVQLVVLALIVQVPLNCKRNKERKNWSPAFDESEGITSPVHEGADLSGPVRLGEDWSKEKPPDSSACRLIIILDYSMIQKAPADCRDDFLFIVSAASW